MVAISLAAISAFQLVLIFFLERTKLLRRMNRRVFLQTKQKFSDINDLFGDAQGSQEASNTEDVLRVTDLISAILGSGLNLIVGAAVALAIAIIGTETHQQSGLMVTGAYVACGVCVAALIALLVMILLDKVQDYAAWKRIPSSAFMKWASSAISWRTPEFYKLVALITSGYLLYVSAKYS